MKLVILLVFVSLAVARPDDSVYDNFDFQEILDSKEKIIEYTDCFRGLRECTPQSSNLKSIISDALQTGCSGCTPRQKNCLAIFSFALRKLAYEEDLKLKVIYNPGGMYDKIFDAFLKQNENVTSC